MFVEQIFRIIGIPLLTGDFFRFFRLSVERCLVDPHLAVHNLAVCRNLVAGLQKYQVPCDHLADMDFF